jgi:hypothetical protein
MRNINTEMMGIYDEEIHFLTFDRIRKEVQSPRGIKHTRENAVPICWWALCLSHCPN